MRPCPLRPSALPFHQTAPSRRISRPPSPVRNRASPGESHASHEPPSPPRRSAAGRPPRGRQPESRGRDASGRRGQPRQGPLRQGGGRFESRRLEAVVHQERHDRPAKGACPVRQRGEVPLSGLAAARIPPGRPGVCSGPNQDLQRLRLWHVFLRLVQRRGAARAIGFSARGWGIAGHSVPEVSWDGKTWHMLDTSLINYFPRADGSPAGVEEIVAGVQQWLRNNPGLRKNNAKLDAFMRNGGWRRARPSSRAASSTTTTAGCRPRRTAGPAPCRSTTANRSSTNTATRRATRSTSSSARASA